MAEKLVVVIMGQNCEKFIGMALESVRDADSIVYCDGGSEDGTLQKIADIEESYDGEILVDRIFQKYDQEDKTMNGKQRNFYLNYVKKNYPDHWCLAIDADEVVEDLSKIKEFIQNHHAGIYSPRMRHLIGDLSHEDATQQIHPVLNRLFKISKAEEYPEVEHPVLRGKNIFQEIVTCTTIWHLAYCPNMWNIKKRYDNHLKKSNMHTPEYLKSWYFSHLFGQYPKKQFNPVELPKVILKEFGIDKDELYFANRGLELKHFLMVRQWEEFFKPKSVLDVGCGKGPYLFAWETYVPEIVEHIRGIEISKYAVTHQLCPSVVQHGDVLNLLDLDLDSADLVTAIDLLEHLEYSDIDKAIENIKLSSKKHILVSVPFKGTPNCENDPTHIIKEDREWWVKKFTDKGLKEVEVPEHFLFKEQLLIFKNE